MSHGLIVTSLSSRSLLLLGGLNSNHSTITILWVGCIGTFYFWQQFWILLVFLCFCSFKFFFFFIDIINSHYSLCIQWSLYFNYFLLFYNSCTILFCINVEIRFNDCFSSWVFDWNVCSGLVVPFKPKKKWIQSINCKKWAHELCTPGPNNFYACQNCESALESV